MTAHAWIAGPEQRAVLNRQLHATGADTGFWNDHGHPTPWPDDIDEWRPSSSDLVTRQPGEKPF